MIKASNEYNIDLKKCVVIGDRLSDMSAGSNAGTKKVLVKTGVGNESLRKYIIKCPNVKLDYVADNILDAVLWILS